MNLANGITQAYQTKWSFVNSFKVDLILPSTLLYEADWTDYDNEQLQLNIVSIDTTQFTNSTIEAYVADKWVTHNGRDEMYRFTMTFRDQNQMELYKKFVKMYRATRLEYFDDVKITIDIYKEADWGNEVMSKLLTFENVLIESVSQIQFSNNTENQIAEFSVGFKSTKYDVH